MKVTWPSPPAAPPPQQSRSDRGLIWGFNAIKAKHYVLLYENGADAFPQTSCNVRGQGSDTAPLRAVGFEMKKKTSGGVVPLREREKKEKKKFSIWRITPFTAEFPKFPPVICLHVQTN